MCFCSECGITKTKFIARKTGGAISKTNFSCGYDLKGKRPGTVEECFKKGQIRRWGIKKLDDGYIDALLADRVIDRNEKARARRKAKKPAVSVAVKAKTQTQKTRKPVVNNIKTPIDAIQIKPPPERMTPFDIEKMIDIYENVPKRDEVMNRINNVMNKIENKKDGSTMKMGKIILKKVNDNEYQLNYKAKDDYGKPVLRNFITGSKSVIKDYLYKIESRLIVWADDRPVVITDLQ